MTDSRIHAPEKRSSGNLAVDSVGLLPNDGRMERNPIAYLLTWTCYGTRLRGDERGWVSRDNRAYGDPLSPPDEALESRDKQRLKFPPYHLDERGREISLRAILEACHFREWDLLAAHVRTNHVHVVVSGAGRPERILADLKRVASVRLANANGETAPRKRWSDHGSTRYLWANRHVEQAIRYVVLEQGEPLAVYAKPGVLDAPV